MNTNNTIPQYAYSQQAHSQQQQPHAEQAGAGGYGHQQQLTPQQQQQMAQQQQQQQMYAQQRQTHHGEQRAAPQHVQQQQMQQQQQQLQQGVPPQQQQLFQITIQAEIDREVDDVMKDRLMAELRTKTQQWLNEGLAPPDVVRNQNIYQSEFLRTYRHHRQAADAQVRGQGLAQVQQRDLAQQQYQQQMQQQQLHQQQQQQLNQQMAAMSLNGGRPQQPGQHGQQRGVPMQQMHQQQVHQGHPQQPHGHAPSPQQEQARQQQQLAYQRQQEQQRAQMQQQKMMQQQQMQKQQHQQPQIHVQPPQQQYHGQAVHAHPHAQQQPQGQLQVPGALPPQQHQQQGQPGQLQVPGQGGESAAKTFDAMWNKAPKAAGTNEPAQLRAQALAQQQAAQQRSMRRKDNGDKRELVDFEIRRVIGKGSYGKVLLVRDRHNSNMYAMKMLRKDMVQKRNQVEHTKTERNVLEAVAGMHPFIVSLFCSIQTAKKLYFVMEYCPGGELFFHLSRAGRFSESRCRFYTCEIALALEYLHQLDIIYRDLKPENVLLDGEGHVKITDFGLSKECINDNHSARSMCGTPEYLAPEILDRQGHGKAVDWYSLGALMYEMLTGLPPYYTRDRDKLFEKIRSAELHYPALVHQLAKDLLQKMLERNPNLRLGAGPGDAKEIKTHLFFDGIEWERVRQKGYRPPFAPQFDNNAGQPDVKNDSVQYFDKEFIDLPAINSEMAPGYGSVAASQMASGEGLHFEVSFLFFCMMLRAPFCPVSIYGVLYILKLHHVTHGLLPPKLFIKKRLFHHHLY